MSLREKFRPRQPPPAADGAEAKAAQVLQSKRGRTRWAPPPAAAKAVASVLKPLLRETGLGLNELKRRWAEIAGQSFARATPERFSAGVLTLKAPSALAPFLQQQTPLLVERLRLAGAKVKSVRIEQRAAATAPMSNLRPIREALTPEQEAALALALDPVGDPGLKSALMRLGRAVGRN